MSRTLVIIAAAVVSFAVGVAVTNWSHSRRAGQLEQEAQAIRQAMAVQADECATEINALRVALRKRGVRTSHAPSDTSTSVYIGERKKWVLWWPMPVNDSTKEVGK